MIEIQLEPLKPTDAQGGRHIFWCSATFNFDRWLVNVWETQDVHREHYTSTFKVLTAQLLQSAALDNHGQRWSLRRGISEAVFALVHKRSSLPIVSSRAWVEGNAEWRTPHATAMWERFVRNGLAAPLVGAGRFVYPSSAPQEAMAALKEAGL